MTVVIENGTYGLWNLGDIAMLQVLTRRILEMDPQARIGVVTERPEGLAKFIPSVKAVMPGDWNRFHEAPRLMRLAKRSFRSTGSRLLRAMGIGVGDKENGPLPAEVNRWLSVHGIRTQSSYEFVRRLGAADAVVASGGGYMADAFLPQSLRVIETLDLAQRMGKPTALFGQGIGPMRDPRLLRRASEVLPGATLVGVREPGPSVRLLRSLCVAADRIAITGDDAIESAMACVGDEPREAIGFNLRVSSYSGIDSCIAAAVGKCVKELGAKMKAELVLVPIAIYRKESDVRSFCEALSLDQGAAFRCGLLWFAGRCGEKRLTLQNSGHGQLPRCSLCVGARNSGNRHCRFGVLRG